MFSHRLPWDAPKNKLSQVLASKRAQHAPLLDLTESNPTRVGLEYPEAEILSALADPRALVYEPDPRGLRAAREAIAAGYSHRGQLVDPNHVLLTASTSEAYAFLFKLLCEPGDAVLVPTPSYPLFEFLADLDGVRLTRFPLAYDGTWHIDLAGLEEALARESRARAILIVNPNNPTGSFLKRDEQMRLCALAAAHDLTLVSDEVFADYPVSDAPAPDRIISVALLDAPCLCVSLGGLSKGAGLPQLKLGWMVVGGSKPLRDVALDRLEIIADTYLSVSSPVALAAPRLFELGAVVRQRIQSRIRENRAWLSSQLEKDSPIQLLPAEGGWYAILRLPNTLTDEELALRLLSDHSVLAHPGYFFDLPIPTCLVISLLCAPDVFQRGALAILRG
ncbi:MAG: pyridoxal phosphate-dependent aminotransferase [Deltaproteobacteria bacterium]|nr:pyridoxal phosphate-dependent aminotransferase [Deltaproteobacteria bacterium]